MMPKKQDSTATEVLWTPSAERIASSNATAFINQVNENQGTDLKTYREAGEWSTSNLTDFWSEVWDFGGVVGDKGSCAFDPGPDMAGARFFTDATLNYAENLLKRDDDGEAIVYWAEDKLKRHISWRELREMTSLVQQVLQQAGVKQGDRIAAYLPNMPETIAIMLAAAGLGAVVSTASPDFGVQGVLDRFGQIEPKVLFVTDGYWWNGKEISVRDKVDEVVTGIKGIAQVIEVPLLGNSSGPHPTLAALTEKRQAKPIHFEPMDFNAPLYVLFSSGTTGKPKCMVHRAGGTLLKHITESQLAGDIKRDDRVFYFTTTGWMMWNWLASVLAADATIILYDGSPMATPDIVFDVVEQERATLFGTSAKFIDAINKAGLSPKTTHDLSSVRSIMSTGSTLVHEGFDYVYEHIKEDVHLASVSGGTDIVGCFVGGDPHSPVVKGEIQAPVLGMAMAIYDDDGNEVIGEKGELICTKPFPSLPITFYGEGGDARYRDAYFDRFENVWCHGDYVQVNPETGGYVFYGRSDATLNPGGVRIGTAEIYRQVEQLSEVAETIVVGQEWQNDTRVVLFVRLTEGAILNDDLKQRMCRKIRDGASPRHVPQVIAEVTDIPRTRSGKIVELAVRDTVHNRAVKNVEALANAEALEQFRNRPELQV